MFVIIILSLVLKDDGSKERLEEAGMKETFLIVDGNSLMHRAFHALPLMDADGIYTNAIYGFLSMLLKAVREENAKYLAICFDEHIIIQSITVDFYMPIKKIVKAGLAFGWNILTDYIAFTRGNAALCFSKGDIVQAFFVIFPRS